MQQAIDNDAGQALQRQFFCTLIGFSTVVVVSNAPATIGTRLARLKTQSGTIAHKRRLGGGALHAKNSCRCNGAGAGPVGIDWRFWMRLAMKRSLQ
jgi:hypothetical protein